MNSSSSSSCVAVYPPDLLYAICSAVFYAAQPPPVPSLDPLLNASGNGNGNGNGNKYSHDYGNLSSSVSISSNDHLSIPPASLPSSYPPPNWPEPIARRTLHSLSLVSRSWHSAAIPWLYRKIEVRLPRSWLSFVDEITCGEDEEEPQQQSFAIADQTLQNAASLVVAAAHLRGDDALRIQECVMETLESLPDGSIPPELLSPPASRDPSPQRLRAKSPARWRLLRSITDAVVNVTVPTPDNECLGRHTRSLDFNHFRTIGMRRSVGEGLNSRFVTGDRLHRVLKAMPNLEAFGATEYMDGALTFPVLTELLLRGRTPRDRGRSRRPTSDDDDAERRKEYKPLSAVDFCGCVSSVFVNALNEFTQTYLRDDTETGPLVLPEMQRLGMRGVRSVPSFVLTSFVMSFPSLTHLDLSGTLCSPELLEQLAAPESTLKLTSLALGRCGRLTSESITHLLVNGKCTHALKELSLYGDMTFGSALNEEDLLRIVLEAPCFLSGELQYLDLSNSPVTPSILKAFSPQRQLRSLGLAHILTLSLMDIASFLLKTCPNVEVLALVNTSPELSRPPRQATLALHSQLIQPLATAPLSFSITQPSAPKPVPTRLRVIELSTQILSSLGAGAGSWRIVRSKGGRGWYVDTASAWISDTNSQSVLKRDLPPDHPFRVELVKLADLNGNVNSGIGWHARKMEILHGYGMFGREDGLFQTGIALRSKRKYQEPVEKESPQSTSLDEQSPTSNPPARMRKTKTRQTTADRRTTATAPSRQRTRTRTGLGGVREAISTLLKPPKKLGVTTTGKSLRAVVTASWLNVLLICIPVSWALHFAKQGDLIIFVFSFLAIVPLAKLLGFATEELSLRVGQTIGGLLNATLIIALTQCKLAIVQSSLIGSILSNILLVLGMCFFAGGINKAEQGFLASAHMFLPYIPDRTFLFAVDKADSQTTGSGNSTGIGNGSSIGSGNNGTNSTAQLSPQMEGDDILKMSRGLWSHAHLYEDDAAFQSTNYPADLRVPHLHRHRHVEDQAQPLTSEMTVGGTEAHPVQSRSSRTSDDPEALTVKSEEDEEIEVPQLSVPVCIGLLIAVTVLVAVTAEFLVDSINGVTENTPLTQQWVGLILLPIVGNAAG
ncbi:hypothetical protein Clacol_002507 [Clathrus columnatus]|uniref:F-box domain-containing protein n=1 Tax=Clathrus columnatus TaxID=1419009 RepID=A0AAV5A0X8_9AGAM|nr:hypothetical protein Clacol_002507 [Clathrus columnatus]